MLKKIFPALVIFVLIALYEKNESASDTHSQNTANPASQNNSSADDAVFRTLFQNQRSNVQVMGAGTVSRILSDDNDGSRHQRFIVRLDSGQTLLIAHNIDLAPRINTLSENDTVTFYGEYEWNSQGGVIHWTHKDPDKRHTSGWIVHNRRTYQ